MTVVPSTIGEVDVPYSCGAAGAVLRHNNLPVARSCAEKMPLTPWVNTRPSAIAGVDFGPGPWPVAAEFMVYGASTPSCHSCLPEARSNAVTTSRLACRECTMTRLPAMTGEAWPRPTVACHFFVSCAGQVAGAVNPDATPSRFGPRHWGQLAVGVCAAI